MLKSFDNICIAAYLKIVLACQMCGAKIKSFCDDENGLSGVVVAVLLILVAVLAVVMIWGFLSGWIGDMWKKITGAADSIA